MHFHTLTAATQLLLLLFCTVARADKGSLTIGYYSTWTQKATEAVGFSKYTHVIIAFAEPHPDGTFAVADFDVPDAVSKINKDGAHALVSIGGWSYSGNFSTIMATSDLRTAFAKNIVDYVELNKLAGIDIDWEFPGSNAGDEENTVDEANDTINYLTFLQELRKLLDSKFPNNRKLIMMAVGAQPFCVNGAPMTDLSEFAHVVDYANLMLYDFYGSFSETSGPNAPLSGTGNSVKSVIKTWTDAKWPAAQLIAGFAFYGHSFLLSSHPADISTNQIQPKSSTIPQGGKSDTESPHSGVWQYNNLRTDILSSATTANAPWVRYWDNTSMTPYLYNKETCVLISYDDPESIQAKVQYAVEAGIPGGMVWTIDMDCHHELLDVVSAWQSTNGSSIDSGPGCVGAPVNVCSDDMSDYSTANAGQSETATTVNSQTESSVSVAIPESSASVTMPESSASVTMPESSASVTMPVSSASATIPESSAPYTSTPNITSTEVYTLAPSSTIELSTDAAQKDNSYKTAEYSSTAPIPGLILNPSCRDRGVMVCNVDGDSATEYAVCIMEKWVFMNCPENTKCVQSGSYAYCASAV